MRYQRKGHCNSRRIFPPVFRDSKINNLLLRIELIFIIKRSWYVAGCVVLGWFLMADI